MSKGNSAKNGNGILSGEIRSLQALAKRVAEKGGDPSVRLVDLLKIVEFHGRACTRLATLLHAWNLPTRPDPRKLDYARYKELTLRAASNIFQPMGVSEENLTRWVDEQGMELELWGRDWMPRKAQQAAIGC